MTTPTSSKIELRVLLSLASVLMGTLIGTMSNSMVSIALPSLMAHFDVPLTSAVWSVTVYTLTFAVFIPIFGVLGPSIGYKRMYLTGTMITSISSILCIIAPNFTLFLLFRFCLGIGTATILPTIMGIILTEVPVEAQGQATGYWAFVNSIGHAIGPPLGGILIQYLDWPGIFLVNLPLALGSFILTSRFMRPSVRMPIRKFDYAGATAMTVLAFTAIFAITFAAQRGAAHLTTIVTFSGALISLLFLRFYERKVPNPFVNTRLFANAKYVSSALPICLQAFTQFGLLVSLPFFLIDVNKMDKQLAGTIIMSMTLIMAFLSPLAGRLTDRYGPRTISRAGNAFVIAGSVPFLLLRFFPLAGWVWALFVLGLVLYGTGFGLIQSSATVGSIQSVTKEMASAATGFFHMLRFLSGSFGSTIIGIILEVSTGGIAGGFFLSFYLLIALGILVFPMLQNMPTRVNLSESTPSSD